ncbi:alpha/beta hydrolase [Novosphingobium resinovorum]|uniref:alpha/beta hydrolase n=1 Tax=Novosphingobium resinovorum TaxID=158500 RepID=UPI002ED5A0B9|nr:alpha/beta hydrolase [Novosphingobium resinovorum]
MTSRGNEVAGGTTRRRWLTGTLAAAATVITKAPAIAQEQAPALKVERFAIWPGSPPGRPSAGVEDAFVKRRPDGDEDDIAWPHVATPMLTVVRPERPNGAAILIVPGGGYARVALGRGGSDIARRFAASGVTAFELLYRLPHDGWGAGPDAPLQDAQRALRIIRAGAGARWTVDPRRVAIAGFSAGGHLAARAAARSALATYEPLDAIDRHSAHADVAGLFYPVVTMLDEGVHRQSRAELLGARQSELEAQRRWSAQLDLPSDMPPTFVCCNADDPVVPAENSVQMYRALHAAGIATELMIFEKGGHGPPSASKAHAQGGMGPFLWLDLFLAFAGGHGWPLA